MKMARNDGFEARWWLIAIGRQGGPFSLALRSLTQQRGCPQKRKGKPLHIAVAPPLSRSLRQGGNIQIREKLRNSAADPVRDPVLSPKSHTRCGCARSSRSPRPEPWRRGPHAEAAAQNPQGT